MRMKWIPHFLKASIRNRAAQRLPVRNHHIPALQAGNPTFNLCATDIADLTARAAVLQAWKSIAAVKNGFIVTQHRCPLASLTFLR